MGKVAITNQLIEAGKSSINQTWSRKQLWLLGVPLGGHLKKGWKLRIIGTLIDEEVAEQFVRFRDAHFHADEISAKYREMFSV